MSRLGCPLFEVGSRGETVFCLVPHYWDIIRSIKPTGKPRRPLKRVLLNHHFHITGHRPSITYKISQVGSRLGAPSTLLLVPTCFILRGNPYCNLIAVFILSSLAIDSLARTSPDGDLPHASPISIKPAGKLAQTCASSGY